MEEINLYKLMGFYVRNWLLILSLTLTGLAAGLIYNQFIQVPMYKSNATLLLTKERGVTQDVTLLNNYVQLFQSRRVLEPVIKKQKIDATYNEFAGNVSATNAKSTEVLKLSVSTNDPQVSRDFLREAVIIFKAEAKKIYGSDDLTVVDNASNAVPPYNVKKLQQLAIASAAGFVVSLLVLFFIYDARGGKVDNWGKKSRRVVKEEPAPQTVVPEAEPAIADEPASMVLVDVEPINVAPKAPAQEETLIGEVKKAVNNGAWIAEPTEGDQLNDKWQQPIIL